MRPGPLQNPYTFSGKREPMFVIKAIFLAFAQTLYPFSKDFPWFKPNFLPIWPMFRDSFWRGVKMGPTFTDFLFKIHPFGRHIPMYLTYVKFLPLGTCIKKGHPNISDFINLWHASLWEFRNRTMKKVLERGTFLNRHMWSSSPLDTSCRPLGAPKWFWFHQFMECIVMGT